MKPTRLLTLMFPALLAIGVVTTSGCTDDDVNDIIDNATSATDSSTASTPDDTTSTATGISIAEKTGMIFMREEEKLAHDVYLTLYETWNQQIFSNIAQSEQQHMDAVLTLLNTYNVPDPIGDNGRGVFVDQELQKLHDELVNKGISSLIDALQVGAAIEEIDIIDLEKREEDIVGHDDIINTYEMLLKGSRNHLRAFVKDLKAQGIDYQPQYLSQAVFDDIINGDTERGNH